MYPMSSETLYRKYRSKSFKDVIGQEHITKTLANSIQNKTFAHAYLLTGPRGVGKTSIARLFAYAVNGLQYGSDEMYSDIIEIDAASNRRIDEIRELRDKVNIAPSALKYKVYIIDEVHMLTREAFNALLKTLEEPPEHAIFILATTDFQKVPDTIASRCVRFAFSSISSEDIAKHLKNIAKKESIDIDAAAVSVIADNSDGSFRDAISLLDQFRGIGSSVTEDYVIRVLGMSREEEIGSLIRSVEESNPLQIVRTLKDIKEKGANDQQIIKQSVGYLRSCLLGSKSSSLAKDKIISLMHNLLRANEYSDIGLAIEIAFIEACRDMAQTNPPKTKEKIEQPTPPAEASNKKDNPKIQSEEVKEVPATNVDFWEATLKELKSANNTLYAIARMAETKLAGDELELYFKFPFHYKQISLEKNHSQVQTTVSSINPSINKVSLFLEEKEATLPKNTSKEPVNRISNIFGPSEVLES